MKSILKSVSVLFLLAVGVSGCIKDQCTEKRTYTYLVPVYKTSSEVRAAIRLNKPEEIQNPGKIFLQGNYIFLNEVEKGVHVINNQNPSQPVQEAFIHIPGNLDLAVNGNALYADLYTDLVTMDISNPRNVQVTNYQEGVFPPRYFGFAESKDNVITDWIRRDTTVIVDCGKKFRMDGVYLNYSASVPGVSGIGGSMARFAMVPNKLYTVTNSDLNVFNVSRPFKPDFITKVSIGNHAIETIFPMANKLFIGSQTGMFVYDIINPNLPARVGMFSHVRSCDPVIADADYAYVTLRSGTACMGFTNQMEVLKLNDFTNMQLMRTYPMTNPHGLGKDGNLLFVCDGKDGLKVYDAQKAPDVVLLKHIQDIETYDVIASNNIALVVAKDGLYQYDYSNRANIRLLSKITVSQQ